MKWKKAKGTDGIVVVNVQASGDITITKILDLANEKYESGDIPDILKEGEFIVILKKKDAMNCKKHRTISIVSQVVKIVIKVVRQRLKIKVEQFFL